MLSPQIPGFLVPEGEHRLPSCPKAFRATSRNSGARSYRRAWAGWSLQREVPRGGVPAVVTTYHPARPPLMSTTEANAGPGYRGRCRWWRLWLSGRCVRLTAAMPRAGRSARGCRKGAGRRRRAAPGSPRRRWNRTFRVPPSGPAAGSGRCPARAKLSLSGSRHEASWCPVLIEERIQVQLPCAAHSRAPDTPSGRTTVSE